MLNKKNIISFLCLLFICFSINGFASQTDNKHIEKKETVSQNSREITNERVIHIEGILQPSIKVNESNNLSLPNFKNGKKYFSLTFSCQSTAFSKSFYNSYSLVRMNRISISPFYIAYHRLLI